MYCFAVTANRRFGSRFKFRFKKNVNCFILRNACIDNSSNVFSNYPEAEAKSREKAAAGEKHPYGVNLIGYVRAEMGIGESCRLAAGSLETTGIPFGILNFEIGNPARMRDYRWRHKEMASPKYYFNIFHINPNQMPIVYKHLGEDIFQGRYNIGFWHWELPEFPEDWTGCFKIVNEVWVPSRFVQESVSNKSTVPVVRIPHGIEFRCPPDIVRNHFKLPGSFLFLAMYDVHSQQERKNPKSVIKAFKRSFTADDISVGLVLKINNPKTNPEEIRQLKELIADCKNVYIIDNVLSRDEMNALINMTDCFVSLHRSEGFGLGLAEAMYLGKPVIGTNWSSNTDFMNNQNSCPVNYQIISVGQDNGLYKAHQFWAEPDVEHASYFMKKLAKDSHFYQMIGSSGQKTIHTEYSPKVVGCMIKERLERLSRA